MFIDTSVRRTAASIAVVILALGAAVVSDIVTGRGMDRAEAIPVPSRIGPASSVTDIVRFAETSGMRWRTMRARGHIASGTSAGSEGFVVAAARPDRARLVQAGIVRVRDGANRLKIDAEGAVVTSGARNGSDAASAARDARMAAHRTNDPTLSRPGERIVDTPVNDLISPAQLIRRELRLAAVSVIKNGTATVAGRDTLVLEVRFPAELAKEDHWDLYVDMETGVLLGHVIEPLPGEARYEAFIDALEVDPVLEPGLFDTASRPDVAGGPR